MNYKNKIAVVFGGTGFIGRQIVCDLAARGARVKVVTRIPEQAYFLKPAGSVGQIVPVMCDYKQETICNIVKNTDIVVNTIGILFEKSKDGFHHAHVDIPKMIASACKKEKIENFVHISALACERGDSKYAHTKLAGEQEVLQICPQVTIMRPSIVFGEDDSFFNKFAKMMNIMPFLPLIEGGKTKFQPVYVGDVAQAVMQAISHKEAQGHIFELCGPDTVTFKDIYEILIRETKKQRMLVKIPLPLAKMQAFFMKILPNPPLTTDQIKSLRTDNVMNAGALGLRDLNIHPTAMDLILPRYLERYRPGGVFAYKKMA